MEIRFLTTNRLAVVSLIQDVADVQPADKVSGKGQSAPIHSDKMYVRHYNIAAPVNLIKCWAQGSGGGGSHRGQNMNLLVIE